nr:hypothetical protein [Frankia nepalensis]
MRGVAQSSQRPGHPAGREHRQGQRQPHDQQRGGQVPGHGRVRVRRHGGGPAAQLLGHPQLDVPHQVDLHRHHRPPLGRPDGRIPALGALGERLGPQRGGAFHLGSAHMLVVVAHHLRVGRRPEQGEPGFLLGHEGEQAPVVTRPEPARGEHRVHEAAFERAKLLAFRKVHEGDRDSGRLRVVDDVAHSLVDRQQLCDRPGVVRQRSGDVERLVVYCGPLAVQST